MYLFIPDRWPKHIFFSLISAVTLLGLPADVYTFGAGYLVINLSLLIVALATAYVYLPVYFNLNLISVYEYLELRFDSKCRKLASGLYIIKMILLIPLVIYFPALAITAGNFSTFCI